MTESRRSRGAMAHHAGASAEAQVEARYRADGFEVCARRWRGQHGGEIDLIVRRAGLIVFVEVKCSTTHAEAAAHLGPAQLRRIARSAEEFLALDQAPLAPDIRFDLGLVDARGEIEIIQNAHMFD
ncbi:YraN family protein [Rhodobacter lacus]|uniref:YraN family protein n=1 Tax=Rhodobacter lacus TaxID=1641972 RepID=A0ABW5AAV1_9RHOB